MHNTKLNNLYTRGYKIRQEKNKRSFSSSNSSTDTSVHLKHQTFARHDDAKQRRVVLAWRLSEDLPRRSDSDDGRKTLACKKTQRSRPTHHHLSTADELRDVEQILGKQAPVFVGFLLVEQRTRRKSITLHPSQEDRSGRTSPHF